MIRQTPKDSDGQCWIDIPYGCEGLHMVRLDSTGSFRAYSMPGISSAIQEASVVFASGIALVRYSGRSD